MQLFPATGFGALHIGVGDGVTHSEHGLLPGHTIGRLHRPLGSRFLPLQGGKGGGCC
jgi:hypothetical protein